MIPARVKTIRAAVVSAVLAVIVVPSVGYAVSTYSPAIEAKDRIVVRGAVIRLGPSPYVYANSSDAAVGVAGIALISCNLRVTFDTHPDEQVIAAIAEEDEALSRLGVLAGVSGGVTGATVYLYRDGKRICANDKMFGSSANLWLQVTFLAPPS